MPASPSPHRIAVSFVTAACACLALASAGAGQAREAVDLGQARPIAAHESPWLEELTWMEIRDLMAEGTRTVLVPTGGIEQNGPYLALGKHNYVLRNLCPAVARMLGDALCAPVIELVPEGDIDPPSGHMRYPGTISLSEETFEAVLTDVGRSLHAHGFRNVVYIGDSGGNQRGMEAVAARLDAEWEDARALYVPEFYQSYRDAFGYLRDELGIVEPTSDGIHDDFVITSVIMALDPVYVRWRERVDAGLATINGLPIADAPATAAVGHAIVDFRARRTVEAIRRALAGG